MKRIPSTEPTTLGQVLTRANETQQFGGRFGSWVRFVLLLIVRFALTLAISFLTIWWFFVSAQVNASMVFGIWTVLVVLWICSNRKGRFALFSRHRGTSHLLLAGDRQGFMSKLLLDRKTVIIDGSNIYHFGHDNGVGALPLERLVVQLREEEYRVVCFFDANIYFTLRDHKVVPWSAKHSQTLLTEAFGLMQDEIYVVPSGVQADVYILECLKELPISFAVTNDQYRDYADGYQSVMRSNHWRKGVFIADNEVRLRQHSFKAPVRLY